MLSGRPIAVSVWAAALLVAIPIGGISQEPPELPLRARHTVPISGQQPAFSVNPLRCDRKGNVYARFLVPAGRHLASPVTKISPEGRVVAVVRVEDAQGFEKGSTFVDFGIDSRGNVYLLTTKITQVEQREQPEIEQLILKYDSDGKFASSIQLLAAFSPSHIAVFPTGEFLAAGQKMSTIDGVLQPISQAFTAVFDRSGALVREVILPEDIEPKEDKEDEALTTPPAKTASPASAGQTDSTETTSKLEKREYEVATSLGVASASEDGNIYLMRATQVPLIFVISRDGTVVRRFPVDAPSQHSRPVAMQVASGKVAVMFMETDLTGKFKRHVFVVANAETGETLARYVGTPEIGGAMACYTANGFAFLATRQNQLVILHSHPY